jgi:hypothetical protein
VRHHIKYNFAVLVEVISLPPRSLGVAFAVISDEQLKVIDIGSLSGA